MRQSETIIEQDRIRWENWTKVDQGEPDNNIRWLAVRIKHILTWWNTIKNLGIG